MQEEKLLEEEQPEDEELDKDEVSFSLVKRWNSYLGGFKHHSQF